MAFLPEERERLLSDLIDDARHDPRLSGAAVTGSGAVGRLDRWSDIDLSFGISDAGRLSTVMTDWTMAMYARHDAVHHFDMPSGNSIYRVFLLRNTLQVDLAFTPASDFGPRAKTFRLLFGQALEEVRSAPPPDVEHLIGLGWLYALHARACIQRGQLWRAEYMVGAMRSTVLTLACLRVGVEWANARGVDRLPASVTGPLEGALVRAIERAELGRAFAVAADRLLEEASAVNPELLARIAPTVRELVRTATQDQSKAHSSTPPGREPSAPSSRVSPVPFADC